MDISFIVASNNPAVLRSSLLASPDVDPERVIVAEGHSSAASAYNYGIRRNSSDIAIFVHQDVYLPKGWLDTFRSQVKWIEGRDPNWGVVGAFGIDDQGNGIGHLYSTGLKRRVGKPFAPPTPVRTLDEVLFAIRTGSGLTFDESLPGFHLYGTDICLSARSSGLSCYAIDAFCVHNTNGIGLLGKDYWRSWRYIRRKWLSNLPIVTPCMTVSKFGVPALRYLLTRPLWLARNPGRLGTRLADPRSLSIPAVAEIG